MAGEQVLIDAGLVVEAFQVGGRNQLDEILVALLVLAQQDEVVVAVGVGARLVALLGDIDLAADDGVNAFRLGGVIELDGAEQVAVIGHGDRGHLLLGDRASAVDIAGPVEQGVVGVAVKVNEMTLGLVLFPGEVRVRIMVGTGGFEPPTCRLGGDRSIQLSYVPDIILLYLSGRQE